MFKVHNNMAPEYLFQKVLKMRSTFDTRGSSSPLLIASSQKQVLAIGEHLIGKYYARTALMQVNELI